ncbi:hypothetical protein OSTOST_20201 [Ostertagia ostertagi]
MFDDTDYMRQKETIIEKTEEAFEEGFLEALKAEREKKEKPVESSSDSDFDIDDLPGSLKTRKRKAGSTSAEVEQKKTKLDDEDDDSSSDSEENDVDPELLREIQDYFTAQNGESSKSLQDEKPTTSEVETLCVTDCSENASENVEVPPSEPTESAPEKEKISEATDFPAVDLSLYDSAVQLEELGLNHLKHALIARGMKCGGTLRQRAERLFSAKKDEEEKT